MSDHIEEPHASLVPPTPPDIITPAEERGRRYLAKAGEMQNYMLGNLLFVGIAHGLLLYLMSGTGDKTWSAQTILYLCVILLMGIGAVIHIGILKPLHQAQPWAWHVALWLPLVIISGVLFWYFLCQTLYWGNFAGGSKSIAGLAYFVILLLPLTPYFICSIVSSVYLLKTEVRALVFHRV